MNWAEAYSIRHSCFNENRTTSTSPPGTTCISLLSCFRPFHPKIQNHGYNATDLTLSSLPPRYIELATRSLMLSSKRETETEIVFYFCGDKMKRQKYFPCIVTINYISSWIAELTWYITYSEYSTKLLCNKVHNTRCQLASKHFVPTWQNVQSF